MSHDEIMLILIDTVTSIILIYFPLIAMQDT